MSKSITNPILWVKGSSDSITAEVTDTTGWTDLTDLLVSANIRERSNIVQRRHFGTNPRVATIRGRIVTVLDVEVKIDPGATVDPELVFEVIRDMHSGRFNFVYQIDEPFGATAQNPMHAGSAVIADFQPSVGANEAPPATLILQAQVDRDYKVYR